MKITTIYSIGDRVNLNYHNPATYYDETGVISGMMISINNTDYIEITYWYEVGNHSGCFSVKEPGKICKEYYAVEYRPLD